MRPKKQNRTRAMVSVSYIISPEPISNQFLFIVALLLFHCAVPSANKKDVRTIEDVQADIQAKKKLKITHATTSNADAQPIDLKKEP